LSDVDETRPRISLVVPAWNEERWLPRLLASVETARERFDGTVEVVVADNASTDRTAAIATEHGCRVVAVARRCIAAARNGGARASTGEIVAFVDADSRIHPDTFGVVDARMRDPRIVCGATGVWPDRWSPGIVVCGLLIWPLLAAARVDAGVVFCRRADFDAVGGYDEAWNASEDVRFLRALRVLGRRRRPRQRFTRTFGVETITSMRKFDRLGDWHFLPLIARGTVAAIFGRARFNRYARSYWYDESARAEPGST